MSNVATMAHGNNPSTTTDTKRTELSATEDSAVPPVAATTDSSSSSPLPSASLDNKRPLNDDHNDARNEGSRNGTKTQVPQKGKASSQEENRPSKLAKRVEHSSATKASSSSSSLEADDPVAQARKALEMFQKELESDDENAVTTAKSKNNSNAKSPRWQKATRKPIISQQDDPGLL